jgi:hypothetical protein
MVEGFRAMDSSNVANARAVTLPKWQSDELSQLLIHAY